MASARWKVSSTSAGVPPGLSSARRVSKNGPVAPSAKYWVKTALPSSSVTTVLVVAPRVAPPVGLDSVTVNVSVDALPLPAPTGTVIVALVCPAGKFTVPVDVVKSLPAVAVPADVL